MRYKGFVRYIAIKISAFLFAFNFLSALEVDPDEIPLDLKANAEMSKNVGTYEIVKIRTFVDGVERELPDLKIPDFKQLVFSKSNIKSSFIQEVYDICLVLDPDTKFEYRNERRLFNSGPKENLEVDAKFGFWTELTLKDNIPVWTQYLSDFYEGKTPNVNYWVKQTRFSFESISNELAFREVITYKGFQATGSEVKLITTSVQEHRYVLNKLPTQ